MNYKIKLQPGDAVFIKGIITEKVDEIIKRFIIGGCPASRLKVDGNWVMWLHDDSAMWGSPISKRQISRLHLFATEPEQKEPLTTRTLDQYIVWGPKGKTNPKFVHGSFDAALTEAERMSREHVSRFCVCGIIATVDAKTVTNIETEVTLNDEEQIPF